MAARSSLLRALTLLQAMHPGVTLNQIVAFLHVAEEEGRTVGDIAEAAGFTQSTASRSLRANGAPESGWALQPALGLLEACLAEWDGRSHQVFLSGRGRLLREGLDKISLAAEPLAAKAPPC